MKKKSARVTYSSFSIMPMIIVTIFMAIGCYVAVSLERSAGLTTDATSEGLYTLSEDSLSILGKLNNDIVIYTLNELGGEDARITTLLQKYAAQSEYVTVTNVVPSENPNFITQYDASVSSNGEGKVIITGTDRSRYKILGKSDFYDENTYGDATVFKAESKITAAINYINTGVAPRACFLTGHSEIDVSQLGGLSQLLDGLNYEVSAADSKSIAQLDSKSDILFIVAPKNDLSEAEYVQILSFIDKGGNVICMMQYAEYISDTGTYSFREKNLEVFDRLFLQFGMELGQNLIVCTDEARVSMRPTTAQMSLAEGTQIEGYSDSEPIVFSESSSITLNNTEAKSAAIIMSPQSCYLRTAEDKTLEQRDGDELESRITAAVGSKGKGKLVLISSSSLVKDQEIAAGGNKNFLLSAVKYFSTGNEAITIDNKDMAGAQLTIESDMLRTLTAMAAILICPIIITVVWLVQRIAKNRSSFPRL